MQHTLLSQTTAQGHRAHTITTSDRDFAFAMFEQALEVDNEPDFTPKKKGVVVIAFICDDAEAAAAIVAATSNAARGLVGAA